MVNFTDKTATWGTEEHTGGPIDPNSPCYPKPEEINRGKKTSPMALKFR